MTTAIPACETGRPVAVAIRQIDKWFGHFQVLKQINLDVHKGEKIVICGPSGSGKSTLIRCINGLEKHDCGQIVVNGIKVGDSARALLDVRREVGMVFQQFNLFPHLTSLENCMLAPRLALHMPRDKAEALAIRYLARVHVAEQAGKYPAQLSGGQQQRVAVEPARFDYTILEDTLMVSEAWGGTAEMPLAQALQVPKHYPLPRSTLREF